MVPIFLTSTIGLFLWAMMVLTILFRMASVEEDSNILLDGDNNNEF